MKIFFLTLLAISISFRAQSQEVAAAPTATEAPPVKEVLSDNIEKLDEAVLRKKLEKIHGEFGRAQKSKWEVAFGGQIVNWDWNGAWTCPNKEVVDCSAWVPTSLEWFETKTAWLKPWSKIKKSGVLLEAEKRIPSSVDPAETSAEGSDEIPSVNAGSETDEPIRLGGQRLALQAWDFASNEGKELKVFTSLRTSWVERIDREGMREYIEWKRHPKTKMLQVHQIILEKDGQRLTARRVESAEKPKK